MCGSLIVDKSLQKGGGGGEFGGPYGVYSLIAHVLDTSQVRDFV